MQVATNILLALGGFYLSFRLGLRLLLSFSKTKGLIGHRNIARAILTRVPRIVLTKDAALSLGSDDRQLVERRRQSLAKLARSAQEYPKSQDLGRRARSNYSDAGLTQTTASPFIFGNLIEELPKAPILVASDDQYVWDADGRKLIDLSGSLSNNLFGYHTQHKDLVQAISKVEQGQILNNYTEDTHEVVETFKDFSRKDLVSIHMSGTEAVMQACRLARFNTKRSKIIMFAGSYHGWWDGVQGGLGSFRKNKDSLLLAQESDLALTTIRWRRDIAAVLVNPMHVMYPNKTPPADGSTLGRRVTPAVDEHRIQAYRIWLKKLRKICTDKDIALIFDEVYVGHRLGWGGAQKYFDIDADIVTYGKSFGGGLPVGVVCSKKRVGQRIDPSHPLNIVVARGTFQGHPYVVQTMKASLQRLQSMYADDGFQNLQRKFRDIARTWNKRFVDENIPLSVTHFESLFTLNFLGSSPYNWLFPYYLWDAGVFVASYPGTGKLPLPVSFTKSLADEALERTVTAAKAMERSGFWSVSESYTKKELIWTCLASCLS